jgi:carbonic anhydrase/acetyltransferase-like protein (isoleucine patch superfamily)
VLFDSAEITGDVVTGDSHGPVRIGSRVQILENTVLHLLPGNELIVEDDAVIGPGAMIHGCHIGRGSIVEPGAIVCDGSATGAESVVRCRNSAQGPAVISAATRRCRDTERY